MGHRRTRLRELDGWANELQDCHDVRNEMDVLSVGAPRTGIAVFVHDARRDNEISSKLRGSRYARSILKTVKRSEKRRSFM